MAFPETIYVLLKSPNATLKVSGAASETLVDVTAYDGSNYRDTIDASFLGAAVPLGQDSGEDTGWGGGVAVVNPDTPTQQIPVPPGTLTTPLSTIPNAPRVVSLSDEVAHKEPRNEAKKRTLLKFWSGAGGTGNQLAECAFERFVSWNEEKPVRF